MSQVIALTNTARNRLLAALLALIATTAVVLVVAIGDGASDPGPVAQTAQPVVRWDGHPDESAVAAATQSRGYVPAGAGRPDESRIAASIAGN
jgi:hypothetical protein